MLFYAIISKYVLVCTVFACICAYVLVRARMYVCLCIPFIDAARMQDIYLYDNLQYNRYNVKMNGLVSNDGHTLKWTIDEINKPTLKGGLLSVPYNLYEMYFHWGADNCRGSEHTIDGKR